MDKAERIHDFAIKWFDRFHDRKTTYKEVIEQEMEYECRSLDFYMDSGKALSEKYAEAMNNSISLNEIIDDITDMDILGSAIYSKLYYFKYTENKAKDILNPYNRAWFLLALGRLAVLTGENPFLFKGHLSRIHLITYLNSNDLSYNADGEVEQHLIIKEDGSVEVDYYTKGNSGLHEFSRKIKTTMDKQATDRLMCAFSECFSDEYDEIYDLNSGWWNMTLTNSDGTDYHFQGSLCSCLLCNGISLSVITRKVTGITDLFVFGNNVTDEIDRIEIEYHRVTHEYPCLDKLNVNQIQHDYTETLLLDRKSGSIECVENMEVGYRISHKYELKWEVEELLDVFSDCDLFSYIEGNPDDVIDDPDEKKVYRITVDYDDGNQRTIEGSFDRKGLPYDFGYFAEEVNRYIKFTDSEILDQKIYGKVIPRKSDYIFCSVIFEEGGKTYFYLTDEDNIHIGDYVIVPAGRDNHHRVVKVVDVEYYAEENVPLPLDKMKHIISKCEDVDTDDL